MVPRTATIPATLTATNSLQNTEKNTALVRPTHANWLAEFEFENEMLS